MEYEIVRMQAPRWDAVPSVDLRHTGWLPPNAVCAAAQACHNGQTLFLRLEAQEPEIRATLRGPLDMVCNDSCLEFFFAPMAGDRRYFNFECNPLGTLYLGFGAERETRVRQKVQREEQFQIAPYFTDRGWGLTMAVPLDFIRLYFPGFSFSGEAAGNFYKCGDKTPRPHYLSWAPMTGAGPDFHRRQDFGRLVFL